MDTGRDSWEESAYSILRWLDLRQETLSRLRAMDKQIGRKGEFRKENVFITTETQDRSEEIIRQDATEEDIQELLLMGAQEGWKV